MNYYCSNKHYVCGGTVACYSQAQVFFLPAMIFNFVVSIFLN